MNNKIKVIATGESNRIGYKLGKAVGKIVKKVKEAVKHEK